MEEDRQMYDDNQEDYYDKKQKKAWNSFKYDLKFFGIVSLLSILYYLFFV